MKKVSIISLLNAKKYLLTYVLLLIAFLFSFLAIQAMPDFLSLPSYQIPQISIDADKVNEGDTVVFASQGKYLQVGGENVQGYLPPSKMWLASTGVSKDDYRCQFKIVNKVGNTMRLRWTDPNDGKSGYVKAEYNIMVVYIDKEATVDDPDTLLTVVDGATLSFPKAFITVLPWGLRLHKAIQENGVWILAQKEDGAVFNMEAVTPTAILPTSLGTEQSAAGVPAITIPTIDIATVKDGDRVAIFDSLHQKYLQVGGETASNYIPPSTMWLAPTGLSKDDYRCQFTIVGKSGNSFRLRWDDQTDGTSGYVKASYSVLVPYVEKATTIGDPDTLLTVVDGSKIMFENAFINVVPWGVRLHKLAQENGVWTLAQKVDGTKLRMDVIQTVFANQVGAQQQQQQFVSLPGQANIPITSIASPFIQSGVQRPQDRSSVISKSTQYIQPSGAQQSLTTLPAHTLTTQSFVQQGGITQAGPAQTPMQYIQQQMPMTNIPSAATTIPAYQQPMVGPAAIPATAVQSTPVAQSFVSQAAFDQQFIQPLPVDTTNIQLATPALQPVLSQAQLQLQTSAAQPFDASTLSQTPAAPTSIFSATTVSPQPSIIMESVNNEDTVAFFYSTLQRYLQVDGEYVPNFSSLSKMVVSPTGMSKDDSRCQFKMVNKKWGSFGLRWDDPAGGNGYLKADYKAFVVYVDKNAMVNDPDAIVSVVNKSYLKFDRAFLNVTPSGVLRLQNNGATGFAQQSDAVVFNLETVPVPAVAAAKPTININNINEGSTVALFDKLHQRYLQVGGENPSGLWLGSTGASKDDPTCQFKVVGKRGNFFHLRWDDPAGGSGYLKADNNLFIVYVDKSVATDDPDTLLTVIDGSKLTFPNAFINVVPWGVRLHKLAQENGLWVFAQKNDGAIFEMQKISNPVLSSPIQQPTGTVVNAPFGFDFAFDSTWKLPSFSQGAVVFDASFMGTDLRDAIVVFSPQQAVVGDGQMYMVTLGAYNNTKIIVRKGPDGASTIVTIPIDASTLATIGAKNGSYWVKIEKTECGTLLLSGGSGRAVGTNQQWSWEDTKPIMNTSFVGFGAWQNKIMFNNVSIQNVPPVLPLQSTIVIDPLNNEDTVVLRVGPGQKYLQIGGENIAGLTPPSTLWLAPTGTSKDDPRCQFKIVGKSGTTFRLRWDDPAGGSGYVKGENNIFVVYVDKNAVITDADAQLEVVGRAKLKFPRAFLNIVPWGLRLHKGAQENGTWTLAQQSSDGTVLFMEKVVAPIIVKTPVATTIPTATVSTIVPGTLPASGSTVALLSGSSYVSYGSPEATSTDGSIAVMTVNGTASTDVSCQFKLTVVDATKGTFRLTTLDGRAVEGLGSVVGIDKNATTSSVGTLLYFDSNGHICSQIDPTLSTVWYPAYNLSNAFVASSSGYSGWNATAYAYWVVAGSLRNCTTSTPYAPMPATGGSTFSFVIIPGPSTTTTPVVPVGMPTPAVMPPVITTTSTVAPIAKPVSPVIPSSTIDQVKNNDIVTFWSPKANAFLKVGGEVMTGVTPDSSTWVTYSGTSKDDETCQFIVTNKIGNSFVLQAIKNGTPYGYLKASALWTGYIDIAAKATDPDVQIDLNNGRFRFTKAYNGIGAFWNYRGGIFFRTHANASYDTSKPLVPAPFSDGADLVMGVVKSAAVVVAPAIVKTPVQSPVTPVVVPVIQKTILGFESVKKGDTVALRVADKNLYLQVGGENLPGYTPPSSLWVAPTGTMKSDLRCQFKVIDKTDTACRLQWTDKDGSVGLLKAQYGLFVVYIDKKAVATDPDTLLTVVDGAKLKFDQAFINVLSDLGRVRLHKTNQEKGAYVLAQQASDGSTLAMEIVSK